MSSTNNSRLAARYSSTDSSRLRPGNACTREARRQRLPHRVRIRHRRELTQPRAVGELADDFRGGLQRKTRLADPTHPRQGHHRRLGQPSPRRAATRPRDPRTSSPDAASSPANASTDRNGGNSRARPGACTWNIRSAAAKSRNRCSPRSTNSHRAVAHQPTRHQRHHDLAAVRDAHQTSRTIHLTAEIVPVAILRLAGMHPNTHPQPTRLTERLRCELDAAIATAASNASCAVANTAWMPSPVS